MTDQEIREVAYAMGAVPVIIASGAIATLFGGGFGYGLFTMFWVTCIVIALRNDLKAFDPD